MNYAEAKAKAEQYMQAQNWVTDIIILEEHTVEDDSWWIFYCQSKKYMQTRAIGDRWVMGPILVHKGTHEVFEGETANGYEYAIDRYEERTTGILKVYELRLEADVNEVGYNSLLDKLRKIHDCDENAARGILDQLPFIARGTLSEINLLHLEYDFEELLTTYRKVGPLHPPQPG